MEKMWFEKSQDLWRMAVLVSVALCPISLFASPGTPVTPVKTFDIKAFGNQASVAVEDADLSEVLNEIGNKTGIKVTIAKELMKKKISADFENFPLESALNNILRGSNYVLTFSTDPRNKDKRVLKEVEVRNETLGSNISQGEMTTIEIPYGTGKGELGASLSPPIGPRSFAVADNGDIYICDTLNNRIQVYSEHGVYLSTIPLKESVLPEDIVMDENGYIYVLDNFDNFYQYDLKGNVRPGFHLQEQRRHGEPIHLIDGLIYRYDCDSEKCSDVAIGRITSDKTLSAPLAEDLKSMDSMGEGAPSGKKYSTGVNSDGGRTIEIVDADGTTSKRITYPTQERSWIAFKGEDEQGRSYFSANERKENGEAILEIHNLDTKGYYISSVQLARIKESHGPAKSIEIAMNGTIYDFRADQDKLRLYIYRSSPKGKR